MSTPTGTNSSGFLTNMENDLKVVTPYTTWLAGILAAAAGGSKTASTVATTASTAVSASLGLGITSDVGAGFQAVSAVTNLIAQRDREENTSEMVQAANAEKIKALKDHVTAVIADAEATNNFDGIRLLLS